MSWMSGEGWRDHLICGLGSITSFSKQILQSAVFLTISRSWMLLNNAFKIKTMAVMKRHIPLTLIPKMTGCSCACFTLDFKLYQKHQTIQSTGRKFQEECPQASCANVLNGSPPSVAFLVSIPIEACLQLMSTP